LSWDEIQRRTTIELDESRFYKLTSV
jgi:hypothetical protein